MNPVITFKPAVSNIDSDCVDRTFSVIRRSIRPVRKTGLLRLFYL